MIFDFLSGYLSIIIFVFISLFISIGFVLINYLASPKNPDPEKLSAYECGFEAFSDSRIQFDVRFYLGAISLGNIGLLGFYSMMIFLFTLTIGFIYEWKKGALEWD